MRTTLNAPAAITRDFDVRRDPLGPAVVAIPPAVTWAGIALGRAGGEGVWSANGRADVRAGSSAVTGGCRRGIVPESLIRTGPGVTAPSTPGVEGLNEGEEARRSTARGAISGAAGMLEARSRPSGMSSASARAAIAADAVAKRAWSEVAVAFANQASMDAGS